MSLTPEELAARRERIGASDVAAIMGVPTFSGVNAWTVWNEKTDQLVERRSTQEMDAGNRLEPYILDWAETSLGELARNVVVHDPDGARIASTLDGQVVADGTPIEAKTSGIFGPIHGEWGEAGGDEVPDGYMLQCQTQLLCTKAEVCRLFALLGTRGRVEYEIHPEPRLIAKIRDVSEDFYANFVVTKVDPREGWGDRLEQAHGIKLTADPCAPVLAVAKRLRRETGKVIELQDSQLVDKWEGFRKARLDAQKAEDATLAAVLAEIGNADTATLPDGREFRYAEQKGADLIDRKAMKAAGVYERYATPNRVRVARIKGRK